MVEISEYSVSTEYQVTCTSLTVAGLSGPDCYISAKSHPIDFKQIVFNADLYCESMFKNTESSNQWLKSY